MAPKVAALTATQTEIDAMNQASLQACLDPSSPKFAEGHDFYLFMKDPALRLELYHSLSETLQELSKEPHELSRDDKINLMFEVSDMVHSLCQLLVAATNDEARRLGLAKPMQAVMQLLQTHHPDNISQAISKLNEYVTSYRDSTDFDKVIMANLVKLAHYYNGSLSHAELIKMPASFKDDMRKIYQTQLLKEVRRASIKVVDNKTGREKMLSIEADDLTPLETIKQGLNYSSYTPQVRTLIDKQLNDIVLIMGAGCLGVTPTGWLSHFNLPTPCQMHLSDDQQTYQLSLQNTLELRVSPMSGIESVAVNTVIAKRDMLDETNSPGVPIGDLRRELRFARPRHNQWSLAYRARDSSQEGLLNLPKNVQVKNSVLASKQTALSRFGLHKESSSVEPKPASKPEPKPKAEPKSESKQTSQPKPFRPSRF